MAQFLDPWEVKKAAAASGTRLSLWVEIHRLKALELLLLNLELHTLRIPFLEVKIITLASGLFGGLRGPVQAMSRNSTSTRL